MSKFRVLDVYRNQPWYQARPEPEEEFEGMLESMQTVIGPANRPSLAFILRTEGDDPLVYAAGVMDILEPLVGQPLRIWGKTVDFTSEGGTRELWIAMITPLIRRPRHLTSASAVTPAAITTAWDTTR